MTYNKVSVICSCIMLCILLVGGFASINVAPLIILPLSFIYLKVAYEVTQKGGKAGAVLFVITLLVLLGFGYTMCIRSIGICRNIDNCTEPVTATIQSVVQNDSNSLIVLAYEYDGKECRAVEEVSRDNTSYIEGAHIGILINPDNPHKVCSTKVSKSIMGWEILFCNYDI